MAMWFWGVRRFVPPRELCYNKQAMEEQPISKPTTESIRPPGPSRGAGGELSPAERRARRVLLIGAIAAGLFLLGVIALLVFLSLDAYEAAFSGEGPTPGAVVVELLRDAAIIFVAFETLVIGVLLIVLMLQVQSLVVLLRDEIKPMLEVANETLATVRGTTEFVSHNVVSPVIKWSGYLAAVRRIFQQVSGLRETVREDLNQDSES